MASLKQNPAPVIAALYAATLLWLALAAWNPALPGTNRAIDLMLVMDESASIERVQNGDLWAFFLHQAQSLPAGSRISLVRFADRAVVEIPWIAVDDFDFAHQNRQPPRHHYLDPAASDIRAAIDSARKQASINRNTVILISSDGRDTVDARSYELAASASNANISLFHLEPARTLDSTIVQIDSINLPARVSVGQALALSIAIRTDSANEVSLEIIHNRNPAIKQRLFLHAAELRRLDFQLAIDQPGTQLLEFVIRDPQQNIIDRLNRSVDTTGGGKLLHISNPNGSENSELALPPGWTTVQLRADQAGNDEAFFNAFNVIVLDDLAASSLGTVATRNLARSVQQSATGLMVIGGPRSFGSGGYRYSPLEELLPLIAESSRPLPASSFLFLLDKSGSMDARGNDQSRLADAFSAVVESAKSIRAGDESALLAFDREVQVLLPLQRRADLVSALDQPWQIEPSGGTRLSLAVEQAAELLAGSDSQRRFLILVTDGIVDIENSARLQHLLRKGNIRLIVLATGIDGKLGSLRQLAVETGGRLLQVEESAQLPRFMRAQLEMTRHSWSDLPVTPRTLRQPAFIEETIDDWETLPGYQLTRAKPSARIYLATDQGDPLLALGQYGAGGVAALPGGMLASASAGNLSPALISWIDNRRDDANLQLRYDYTAARLALDIDAVTTDNRWQTSTAARVLLTSPAGNSEQSALELVAPGRYSTVMPAPTTGIYRAAITIGDQRATFNLYLQNEAERSVDRVAAWYQKALDEGVLKPWTENALIATLASSTKHHAIRNWWLVLSLITFLCVVAVEYSSAFAGLGKRLARIKVAGLKD